MIRDVNIADDASIQAHKIRGGGIGLASLWSAKTVSGNVQPQTYYVNGDGGSDNWDGLSPDNAFNTIDKARVISTGRVDWTNSPWANQDTILIYPSAYDENITGSFYGMNVIGLGWAYDMDGEMGVKMRPASGSCIDVSSLINGMFVNISFFGPTDDGTELLIQANTMNRWLMQDCVFSGIPGASPISLTGIDIVTQATGSHIIRCEFTQIQTALDFTSSGQSTSNRIEDCYITGGETIGISFSGSPSFNVVRRCDVDGGNKTLALGFSDTSTAELVHVYNTNFEATACDPASGAGHYNNCYLNGVLMA